MKKILTLVPLLLLTLGLGAQEIGCNFVQNKTFKATGKTVRSEGVVFFQAPDQLRMNYLDPKGDYMIIDGSMIRTKYSGKAADIDTQKVPAMQGLRNTLLNCITGEYETAARENDADLTVEEAGGVKTVTMTARKKAVRGYSKVTVQYNKKNLPVRMVLDEFTGISTEYLFEY